MPLWTIYHAPGTFTGADKQELAAAVTERYRAIGLPRFYVVVIFRETSAGDFFVGGEPSSAAVRVVIEHIARQHPDAASRRRAARWISNTLAPFMSKYDGVHWEFHVDETSEQLWMVNGLVPPPGGSDAEKSWVAANAAIPYDRVEESV
ncbi:tautomerase family protein [Mycobacterium sp. M26]|uniref:tautomerase family protein n=1 Tax=Mycobacterium sp. M26 TaxID=1762962 RepID=UPI00073E7D8C|nr:tautomerase family protein [Mycobacterium sp. M26]